MTICKLSGLACQCQPDEGVPCGMEGDGLKNLMLSWRAEAIRLQAAVSVVPTGFKLLRRMPNAGMVEAGREAMSPEKFVSHCRTLWVWNAMWDAAPTVASQSEDYGEPTERVDFETRYKHLDLRLDPDSEDGAYLDEIADAMWLAWEARASRVQPTAHTEPGLREAVPRQLTTREASVFDRALRRSATVVASGKLREAVQDAGQTSLRKALEQIERWDGFPETGKTWKDGATVTYGGLHGPEGQIEHMRSVARAALAAAPGDAK